MSSLVIIKIIVELSEAHIEEDSIKKAYMSVLFFNTLNDEYFFLCSEVKFAKLI